MGWLQVRFAGLAAACALVIEALVATIPLCRITIKSAFTVCEAPIAQRDRRLQTTSSLLNLLQRPADLLMFEHITQAPPDAILGLTEAFNATPAPTKSI